MPDFVLFGVIYRVCYFELFKVRYPIYTDIEPDEHIINLNSILTTIYEILEKNLAKCSIRYNF